LMNNSRGICKIQNADKQGGAKSIDKLGGGFDAGN
jgi:hypothetical protein